MKKKRVCLLFGGKSGEHEVSLQSAKSIYENLDKNKYEILLVGIDKQGNWRLGEPSHYLLNPTNPSSIALNISQAESVNLVLGDRNISFVLASEQKNIESIDVFFPITHGTYGEDGALQGLLELLDVAYVGAGVLGSAVGMDKDVMKRLLRDADIPVARHISLKPHEITSDRLDSIINEFGLPLFVKPANLGSSVGVYKAHNKKRLEISIQNALQFDTKILVEEYIKGREVEVSVLGNNDPIVSIPGEILPQHEFYDYEAKYIDEKGAVLNIPTELSEDIIATIKKTAIQAFQILECSGMARVDFFVTEEGKVVLNEINTLPGFTKVSMYPRLWEASGIPYSELLDRLIELAIEKKQEKDKLKRNYNE